MKIAFGSGVGGWGGSVGAHNARTLPIEAGVATANGLSMEDALRALTMWPAEMYGVSDHVGSIEPGKIGNVIVATGNPMDVKTTIEHLVIQGQEVTTANKHRDLYEKYRGRPLPGGTGPTLDSSQ